LDKGLKKSSSQNVSAYRQQARTDLPPCPASIHSSAIRGKKIGMAADGVKSGGVVASHGVEHRLPNHICNEVAPII